MELGPQYETALILKAIRIALQSLFTSTCCYEGNQLDIFRELHLPCLQRTLFRTVGTVTQQYHDTTLLIWSDSV